MKKILLVTAGVFSIAQGYASETKNAHTVVIGTNVEHRVMQNVKDHFSTDDKNVCAQITLKPSKDENVTFVWKKNDHEVSKFTTKTNESARFRTHACVHAADGQWTVTINDDQGAVLGTSQFTVGSDVSKKTDTKATVLIEEKNTVPAPENTAVNAPEPAKTEKKAAAKEDVKPETKLAVAADEKPTAAPETDKPAPARTEVEPTAPKAEPVATNDAPKAFETAPVSPAPTAKAEAQADAAKPTESAVTQK